MLVAEGFRLVTDVLQSGAKVEVMLAADDAVQDSLFDAARALKIELGVVPRREFDELADTETPSGVLAVVKWEPASLDSIDKTPTAPALIIDGVQDPGNVGTMIRAAFALGARCTIALDGTADVRSPKVVRSAMGALFRHPVVQATWTELRDAWGTVPATTLLAVKNGTPVRNFDRTSKLGAIVIGSEGHGVRAEWDGWPGPHERVTVPMRKGAESLNAAVAAGILLHELIRES